MLILLSFRNLLRNKRRTTSLILTIGLGLASLILFDAFNVGTINQYREDTIHSRYGHGQLNTPGYREQIFEKPWDHWIENKTKILSDLKSIPQVEYVFPRIEFFALLSNGSRSVSGRGQAVDGVEESRFFSSMNIEKGVNLSDQEEGLLLGLGLANTLGLKVGDSVTVLSNTVHGSLNGIDLNVVGIFHTGMKDFDDTYFRMQLPKAFDLLDTDKVESISLGLRSWQDWPAFAAAAHQKIKGLESNSFAVLDEVYYQHTIDWLASQFIFIQAIILAVVFLGILNTFSMTVLERKQEIGNLRANGESTIDVLLLLMGEAFFTGLAGSIVGIVLALTVNSTFLRKGISMPAAPGQTRSFATLLEIEPSTLVIVALAGIVASLLASFFSGLRVVKMPVGEALRST